MFNKEFIRYASVFLGVFLVLYGGTYAFIGITAPGGKLYSEWLANHLNYVSWFRQFLLSGAGVFVQPFGLDAHVIDPYTLSVSGVASVRMVYACLGYGIISFWIAFVVANPITIKQKIGWGFGGSVAIVISNMIRIAVLLIASAKKWPTLFKIDHHTVYSICNYLLIILLIFLFNKQLRKGRAT
jgi:exosortase/archaeosortase family protein